MSPPKTRLPLSDWRNVEVAGAEGDDRVDQSVSAIPRRRPAARGSRSACRRRRRASSRGRLTGDGDGDLPRAGMSPRVVVHAGHAVAVLQEARDLAVLDDVDAAPVGRRGVAPGDRVVARGAARATASGRRGPGIAPSRKRRGPARALRSRQVQNRGIDAVEPHGVAAPGELVHLRGRVGEIDDARAART